MKVFSHTLHDEEDDEVRGVRLGNIENENEVMVRIKSFASISNTNFFLHNQEAKNRVSNLFV